MRARLPCLMTDAYYHGVQEDAEEFLSGMLFAEDHETELRRLCSLTHQALLICARCGERVELGRPELLTILQLSLTTLAHLHTSIAEALAAHLNPEQVDVDLECWREGCPGCRSTDRPMRQSTYTVAPDVLLIQLKRWSSHRAEDALLHQVHPDETIALADATYNLVSVVSHIGVSAHGGHYTATIKYPTPEGDWWYYNDAHSEFTISPALGMRGEEHYYMAFYEKSS